MNFLVFFFSFSFEKKKFLLFLTSTFTPFFLAILLLKFHFDFILGSHLRFLLSFLEVF